MKGKFCPSVSPSIPALFRILSFNKLIIPQQFSKIHTKAARSSSGLFAFQKGRGKNAFIYPASVTAFQNVHQRRNNRLSHLAARLLGGHNDYAPFHVYLVPSQGCNVPQPLPACIKAYPHHIRPFPGRTSVRRFASSIVKALRSCLSALSNLPGLTL